jgi:FAD binding domain of DNA photolyase
MHNRARMIAAMYLTKDLMIDWRLGEKVSYLATFVQNVTQIKSVPAALHAAVYRW